MEDRRLERFAAAGGIIYVVLQAGAQGLIQVGGVEPPFSAPGQAIIQFFSTRDRQLVEVGMYMIMLSYIAFVGFAARLWDALRRGEGDPAWLSAVALGAGLTQAALIAVVSPFWQSAVFRVREGLDPQVARALFDLGNLGFANTWVVIAGLLLATGLSSLRTLALPRWLAWSALAIALGLLVGRVVWTSAVAFIPFVLYWPWLIAVSVVLMRRSGAAARAMS